MHNLSHLTIPVLWLIWLAYWIVSARATKADERRESATSRQFHLGLIAIGALIISSPALLPPVFNARRFTEYEWVYWICAALVAAGLGFACYARWALGRNWSATVTLKQNHELIKSGAYRYVRHPIYTGLLVALAGSAIETGAWRGVIGFALIAIAFVYKYRTEEQFLVSKFGVEYERYKAEVPALVPFFPANR